MKKLWDIQRGGAFLLLAGLAVENLLKAIWVKQHRDDDALFECDPKWEKASLAKAHASSLGKPCASSWFQADIR